MLFPGPGSQSGAAGGLSIMANNFDPADRRDLVRAVDVLTQLLARLELRDNPGVLPPTNPAAAAPAEQLVSLDQCAALVHVTRRHLARYRGRGLPASSRPGRRGRPALYEWRLMRPFLEAAFGLRLPETHPAARHEGLP